MIAWGHATHVGCGWIQFPGNSSSGDFENFMVCNYAIGEAERTSCDVNSLEGDDGAAKPAANGSSFISYYAATSQVIEDIKLCLGAIRCRNRRRLDFESGGSGGGGRSCDQK